MSTFAFEAGLVFELDGTDKQLVRKVENDIWQAEEVRTRRLFEYTETQLRALYAEGRLKARAIGQSESVAHIKPTPADFPDEQWEAARVRRAYVNTIRDLPSTKAVLIPRILETWNKLRAPSRPPNVSTVLRWRARYSKAGDNIIALVERTDRKGNAKSRHPEDLEEIVREAIDAKYLVLERGTIQDTLDHALAERNRENALRPVAIALPRPTRRLIRRLISQIPAFDRCAKRYGRDEAERRFRSAKGHRIAKLPLERAEIDHTLLNLIVVHDQSGLVLGRPWLTVCLEDRTRCVLGLYVSFEPPSHFTVARCLKHALLPKTSVQTDFPNIKNPWAAHGVMRVLVVDNGMEFHSESLEKACDSLGITIEYAPRKQAWHKGKIERFLGTLNRAIAHGVPGTTFHNTLEKGSYDPTKHAVIRFSVLMEAINTWIADIYHQKPHRALDTSPAIAWAQSVASTTIRMPADPTRLDAVLGRSEKKTLDHAGVVVDRLYYNSPALADLRKTLGEKLDVEVRIDDANLGKIIVLDPRTREPIEAHARYSEYAAGLSRYQHKVCRRYAANELKRQSPDAWLEAKLQLAELIRRECLGKGRIGKRVARFLNLDPTALNAEDELDGGMDAPTAGHSERAQLAESSSRLRLPAPSSERAQKPSLPASQADFEGRTLPPVQAKTFGVAKRTRGA